MLPLVLLMARARVRVRAAEERVALLMRQLDAAEATRREADGRRSAACNCSARLVPSGRRAGRPWRDRRSASAIGLTGAPLTVPVDHDATRCGGRPAWTERQADLFDLRLRPTHPIATR
ncbi:hypothetical protein CG736_25490 [Kitasatospora sp. CB02891]|nr:hypothetical protein CG736_25490 [Kitasatospora sp. CB02891]